MAENEVLVALLAICLPFPSLSFAFCRRGEADQLGVDNGTMVFARSKYGPAGAALDLHSADPAKPRSVTTEVPVPEKSRC